MVSSQTKQSNLESKPKTMTEVNGPSSEEFARILSKPPVGKTPFAQDDNLDSFNTLVKGDLKKVSVSPRVELMLNNELFKKYLSRHGNLLEKMAQRQGRNRGTLKKAFSNLDLSKIDLEEELQSENNVSHSKADKQENKENQMSDNNSERSFYVHSQNPATIRTKRSLSLTGKNDPNFCDIQEALKLNEEKTNGRVKTRRSKFVIPSFEEFKKSQKEKLKKGQEFVKDVLRNKEIITPSFMKNMDRRMATISSSRRLPKEPTCIESPTQTDMCPDDISGVNLELSTSSSDVESAKDTLVEKAEQETSNPCPNPRVHRKLPNIENLTGGYNKTSLKGKSDIEIEEIQKTENTQLSKLVTRKERLKSSESFCSRTPEISISSPRRSKNLRTREKDVKLVSSKSFSEDVDPLELSTDGNTVYATLNIFSTDVELAANTTDTEEEEERVMNSKSDENSKNHCACCIRKTCHNCDDDLSPESANARNPNKDSSLIDSKTSEIDVASGQTQSANTRIILRATRKRKLQTKQRKSKTGERKHDIERGLATVRTHPKLTSSQSVGTTTSMREKKLEGKKPQPLHLQLNRSHSCEVFNFNNFSPFSPGNFSFPNSPSEVASFSFPSTDNSNTGSEVDIFVDKQEGCSASEGRTEPFQSVSKLVVSRSTSDVTTDSQRKRRERKQRPYKSDPFNGSSRQIHNRLSQNLLKNNFLVPNEEDCSNDRSSFSCEDIREKSSFGADSFRKNNHRLSNISDVSTDSGVIGPDSIPDAPPSPSSSIFSQTSLFGGSEGQTCTDVDEKSFGELEYNQEKHEKERRETILEIRDTEINYGRDLKILKEEFYKPMKNNGLLTSEQLDVIFQNLEELIEVNKQFTDRLQQAVDAAINAGDELLATVVIGDLFLKSTNLIYSFEHYCVNQSLATIMLEQLEREKDILRIFLKVCQDEHPILRRMHLKSFLMVPVQRIMKYPLLLERLHRATSPNHHDREAIISAKNKIEKILEQINSKTRTASQVRSTKRKATEKKYTVTEKIEVTRVAMEVLGWHKQEVCDILTSQMQVAPLLSDQNWATKRLRNVKFTSVHAVLLTLGQGELLHAEEECLLFPKRSQVIQAAIVLIKEKNGKFQTFRDPFLLNRCIINVDKEMEDIFEVLELNKESCLFKSDDSNLFKLWLQNVKQQTLDLGTWRKRRNALPNIMIKHLV